MTVLAVEAIPEAAAAGEAAGGAAAGSAAAARSPKPKAPAKGSSLSDDAVRQRKAAAASQPAAGRRPQADQVEVEDVTDQPQQSARDRGKARGMKGAAIGPDLTSGTWHRWIMAEFVVCIVLTGASPFLQPGGPAAKVTKVDSLAGPMIRLTAVSVLFFVLAIAGSGPRSGKVAAAFGGLVTLGLIFNALPQIATAGAMFGAKPTKAVTAGLEAGAGGTGDEGTAGP